jgi:hypothetical protein
MSSSLLSGHGHRTGPTVSRANDDVLALAGPSPTSAGPPRLGDLFDPRCPTRQLLDRLGGTWTSMVIKVLDDGRPDGAVVPVR